MVGWWLIFFFSSRRRHTRCPLVTGVQTCALPILPRGATPVDFAYTIHTDIGNQAVAAKINGEFAPLRSELKSGDAVEIITSPASRPSAQWLNYVRTGRARSEIRHYLRTVKYEESIAFGLRLLNQAFDQLHQIVRAHV